MGYLKVFALSTVMTVVAFATYLVVVWTVDSAGGNDGAAATAAVVIISVIWLVSLAALVIRARVSGLWAGPGAVAGAIAGCALAPVIWVALLWMRFAITGESFGD